MVFYDLHHHHHVEPIQIVHHHHHSHAEHTSFPTANALKPPPKGHGLAPSSVVTYQHKIVDTKSGYAPQHKDPQLDFYKKNPEYYKDLHWPPADMIKKTEIPGNDGHDDDMKDLGNDLAQEQKDLHDEQGADAMQNDEMKHSAEAMQEEGGQEGLGMEADQDPAGEQDAPRPTVPTQLIGLDSTPSSGLHLHGHTHSVHSSSHTHTSSFTLDVAKMAKEKQENLYNPDHIPSRLAPPPKELLQPDVFGKDHGFVIRLGTDENSCLKRTVSSHADADGAVTIGSCVDAANGQGIFTYGPSHRLVDLTTGRCLAWVQNEDDPGGLEFVTGDGVQPDESTSTEWGAKSCHAPSAKWMLEAHENTTNVAFRMENNNGMLGVPEDRNYFREAYIERGVGGTIGTGINRISSNTIHHMFDPGTKKYFEGYGKDGFVVTTKHAVNTSQVKLSFPKNPPKDLGCQMMIKGSKEGTWRVIATKNLGPENKSGVGLEWKVNMQQPTDIRQLSVICAPSPLDHKTHDVPNGKSDWNRESWQVNHLELIGKAPTLHHTVPVESSNVYGRMISVAEWNSCNDAKIQRIANAREEGGYGKDWTPPDSDGWCSLDGTSAEQKATESGHGDDTASTTPTYESNVAKLRGGKLEVAPFAEHIAKDLDLQNSALSDAEKAAAEEGASEEDLKAAELMLMQYRFQLPKFNFPGMAMPALPSLGIGALIAKLGLSLGWSRSHEKGPMFWPSNCMLRKMMHMMVYADNQTTPVGNVAMTFKYFPFPWLFYVAYPWVLQCTPQHAKWIMPWLGLPTMPQPLVKLPHFTLPKYEHPVVLLYNLLFY